MRSPHFLLIQPRRGLGWEEGRRVGGRLRGWRPVVRRGRARGRGGHGASASSLQSRAPSAAAPPALRPPVRLRATMPAVDKLLLEEALQDSPQVPPAAPVTSPGGRRPGRPPSSPGMKAWSTRGGPAGREGAPLRRGWRTRGGTPRPESLWRDPFPKSAETDAARPKLRLPRFAERLGQII